MYPNALHPTGRATGGTGFNSPEERRGPELLSMLTLRGNAPRPLGKSMQVTNASCPYHGRPLLCHDSHTSWSLSSRLPPHPSYLLTSFIIIPLCLPRLLPHPCHSADASPPLPPRCCLPRFLPSPAFATAGSHLAQPSPSPPPSYF